MIGTAIRMGELENVLALERKARAKDAAAAKDKLEAAERHWRQRVKRARAGREEQFLRGQEDRDRLQCQVRWLREELADARGRLRVNRDGTQRHVPLTGPLDEEPTVEHQGETAGEMAETNSVTVPEQVPEEMTRLQGEVGALQVHLRATRKERDELAFLHQESLVLVQRAEADRDRAMAKAETEINNAKTTRKHLAEQREANRQLVAQLEANKLSMDKVAARLRQEEDMLAGRKRVAYYTGFEECRLLAIQVEPKMKEMLQIPQVVPSQSTIPKGQIRSGEGSEAHPFDLND